MTKQGIRYTAPSEGFFDIPGVVYRGETGNYRVFERMTPAMTQDKLAELYQGEKPKGNPHPMDSVLYFAISLAGYNLRNESPEGAEHLRQFLRESFRKYPNTLSRIIYNSSEKDKIIHNYRTSDEYALDSEVVGQDGWITKIPDKQILESLLGTDNVDKINKVSNWINGTNGYLWRLNSKPENKEERVVRFGADDNWFYLYCNGNPHDECPAFRVLRIE